MDEEIQALIEQLSDPQFSARKVAAKKLERLGLKAAPGLRQILQSANPIAVARAAHLLGTLGDLEAVPRLRELLGAGDVDVSGAAYDALHAIARQQKSDEARNRMLEELRAARKHPPSMPLLPTTLAPIVTNGSPLPHASTSTSISQAQRRAALTLPDTIAGLIATLGHKDYQKRNAATQALIERGQEAVAPLCAALEERSPVVRQRAVEALGRIQDRAALVPLLHLLRREAESLNNAEATVLTALRDAVLTLINAEALRPLSMMEAIGLVRVVSWQASLGLPYAIFVMAASRLKDLAAETPSPELRSALPYLKGRWPFVPREFAVARKAIEEATKPWADLPIASAEATSTQQNLPVPAAETPSMRTEDLPRPAETQQKKKLAPLPTETNALVAALNSPDAEWRRRVEGALLLRGSDAILPLRWAFEKTTEPVYRAHIAGVLAGIGEVPALVPLWVAWREGLEAEAKVSLRTALLRISTQLPYQQHKLTSEEHLYLLHVSRQPMPALAESVVEALERRAKENPTPELRQALPYLQGSGWQRARVAIEKATAGMADLPIASSGPAEDAHDLPRPADSAIDAPAKNLPRPTRELP